MFKGRSKMPLQTTINVRLAADNISQQVKLERLSAIEDEGLPTVLILTRDLQFQSHASHGSDTHMQKIKVKGQSVKKIEWKQMDEEMDGDDCITSHANAVGNQSSSTPNLITVTLFTMSTQVSNNLPLTDPEFSCMCCCQVS